MSAAAANVVGFDPLRDKRHLSTSVGREIKAWLDWLEANEKAARTQDNYERAVASLALLYPDLPLRKFTDAEILATLKTYPAPSRRPVRYAIGSFFYWAKLTRRIRENPMEWVPKARKPGRKHIETFSLTEVEDLLALPTDDAALMAVLFGFGIRRAEAIGLQVRRLKVAEDPSYLVVLKGKGGKDRKAYGIPDKAQIVREYLLHHQLEPTDHLWYLRPGGGERKVRNRLVSETTCRQWWTRCLDEAGVRKGAGPRERNMHIARHTYATEWLRRGGRLETLSESLGHSSIQITYDLYAHLDERDVLVDLATIAETPL